MKSKKILLAEDEGGINNRDNALPLNVPVIGILRGIDEDFFPDLMQSSFAAGLEAIEITMNTAGAERIVNRSRAGVPAGRLLGMGTIRNIDECRRAVAAGAMFIVTPNLDAGVIEYATSRGIPTVAGALTPTEIYAARQAGAAMVKIFPCSALGGPRYLRELRGPFESLPLAAVGGVSASNVADYFAAGATAVGVGTALFGAEAVSLRNAAAAGRNVGLFLAHCREAVNAL